MYQTITSNSGAYYDYPDVVSYGYDQLGRLQTTQLNGGFTTTYGYDQRSRLNAVDSPQGHFAFGYSGWSDLLTSINRPDGSSSTYGYEGAGTLRRLNSVQNYTAPNGLVSSFSYVYGTGAHRDARVQMTRWLFSQPTEVVNYGYDGGTDTIDQLTSETVLRNGSVYSQATYGYDARGNRRNSSFSIGGNTYASTYSVDALNRLLSVSNTLNGAANGSTSYGYDTNGNLTSESSSNGTVNSYSYDTLDRLVSQYRSQGGTPTGATNLRWDALGRLVHTQEYGYNNGYIYNATQSRTRIYNGSDVLAERDLNGTFTNYYTRAGNIGGVLGMVSYTPNTYPNQYLHYDGSGNVVSISGGGLGDGHLYDAWGNATFAPTNSYASASKWGYSSKETVGSGLVNYGARMYLPSVGRWLNRDPLGEAGGTNLYGFVGNNPVNYGDSYGLWGIAYDTPWGARVGASNPTFLFGQAPEPGPSPLFARGGARGTQTEEELSLDRAFADRQDASQRAITASASMAETGMRGYGEAANQLMCGSALKCKPGYSRAGRSWRLCKKPHDVRRQSRPYTATRVSRRQPSTPGARSLAA